MDRFDLGAHTRTVSTRSPAAQRWFDLGLNWCYAFNQEEGVRCFQRALEADPDCVMAHWGVAYGSPGRSTTWSGVSFGEKEAASAHHAWRDTIILQARALCIATARRGRAGPGGGTSLSGSSSAEPATPLDYDRWDDRVRGRDAPAYTTSIPDDHDVMQPCSPRR